MAYETRQVPEMVARCCSRTGAVLEQRPTGRILTIYRGCCGEWHAVGDRFCGRCGKRLAPPLDISDD